MRYFKNKSIAVLAIALIALGAMLCLYLYLYESTQSRVAEALSARGVLESNQARDLQGKEVMKLHASSALQRAKLESLFVPADNAVAVIQEIESVGDVSGATVTISSIRSSGPSDPKERVGQVSASVSIAGSWNDVMKAIELFEVLGYKKSIQNVNLSYAGVGEGSAATRRWTAGFDISVATIQKL